MFASEHQHTCLRVACQGSYKHDWNVCDSSYPQIYDECILDCSSSSADVL